MIQVHLLNFQTIDFIILQDYIIKKIIKFFKTTNVIMEKLNKLILNYRKKLNKIWIIRHFIKYPISKIINEKFLDEFQATPKKNCGDVVFYIRWSLCRTKKYFAWYRTFVLAIKNSVIYRYIFISNFILRQKCLFGKSNIAWFDTYHSLL